MLDKGIDPASRYGTKVEVYEERTLRRFLPCVQ